MNCASCGKPIWPNKSGLCRLHANRRPRTPEMREHMAEMARRSWADPEVRARRVAGIKAAGGRPDRGQPKPRSKGPLDALTDAELADYIRLQTVYSGCYTRDAALVAIGRADLVGAA